MNTISMELHQEQITELQSQIEELESEKHCLEEELEDIKAEYEKERNSLISESATLKRKCESLEKANATVLNFYREDCGKMDDLHKLNNNLVKSNKAANRDFFILAAAYVATLALMIYLFIR